MKVFTRIKETFSILLLALAITGCGGGEEDIQHRIDPANMNANIGGEKYAHRIEIPRLNDDDYFLTRTTTVNGKENIT